VLLAPLVAGRLKDNNNARNGHPAWLENGSRQCAKPNQPGGSKLEQPAEPKWSQLLIQKSGRRVPKIGGNC